MAHSVGVEISDYTRQHAAALVAFQQQESEIEAEIKDLLDKSEFAAYLDVFKMFRLSPRQDLHVDRGRGTRRIERQQAQPVQIVRDREKDPVSTPT